MSKPTWSDVSAISGLDDGCSVYIVPAPIYEALLRLANEVRQFRISPIGDDCDDIARATAMIERSDDALSEFGPLPEVSDD